MDHLKFVVLDEEDLEVVSTHLQDAVAKVSDVLWRPQEKRVVLAVNRFDWEGAQAVKPEYRRRRTALRFERVLSCKCRDLNPAGKDAVLNLLAVEFSETNAPSGVVTITFSGGGPCGWRSSAWKPNWPISARPGPRRHARCTRFPRMARPCQAAASGDRRRPQTHNSASEPRARRLRDGVSLDILPFRWRRGGI